MKKVFLICFLCVCIMTTVSAKSIDNTYRITANNAIVGQEYVIIIINGEQGNVTLVDNDDSIRYIEQKTATASEISFEEIKPLDFEKATAFIISEEGVLLKCEILDNEPVISIVLPANITLIESEAFKGVPVQNIKIPSGAAIADDAFEDNVTIYRYNNEDTTNAVDEMVIYNAVDDVID